MRVQCLGQEHPQENGMATHSLEFLHRIPRSEKTWQATVHRGTELDTTEVAENICACAMFLCFVLTIPCDLYYFPCLLNHLSHGRLFAMLWTPLSVSSLGISTGVGCHAMPIRIIPAQESNLRLLSLLHWQLSSLSLATWC